MVEKRTVPSDDFASITTGQVTVILSASDAPYIIDTKFEFKTPTCLIYSEKIKLEVSLKHPGKSIGLFCSSIEVTKGAIIDVSGAGGTAGKSSADSNGGGGGDGTAGGNVWVFVQEANDAMMKSLKINAFGGDGGKGGDAGTVGKTGGTGGSGGTGGKSLSV